MGQLTHGSEFHEGLAEGWSARYLGGAFRRRYEFVIHQIAALVRPGQRWLDAGCGSGVFSAALAGMGGDVVGVDGSPSMIEAARASGLPTSSSARYVLIDSLEKLPLDADAFDGVLCLSVLEYVGDVGDVIAELRRVLRPDGTLVATIPNSWSALRCCQRVLRGWGRLWGRKYCDYLAVSRHTASRKDIRELFADHNFTVEHITAFSPVWQASLALLGLGSLWLVIARKACPAAR